MVKRGFDIVFSLLALSILLPFLLFFIIASMIDTQSNGLFFQTRIGQYGKRFQIFKIRTYHAKKHTVSEFGKWLRKTKIDELPQLINVLKGDMSFVGPRPDIPGYYDTLTGEEKKITTLKPGITGLATIKYINEEAIINNVDNKEDYVKNILFPDKIKMNVVYYHNQSVFLDIKILFKTLWLIIVKK